MADPLLQHLEALCQEGDAIDLAEYRGPERAVGWSKKVAAFFRASGGISEAADFEKISGSNLREEHGARVGHLQGLLAKERSEQEALRNSVPALNAARPANAIGSKKVFVVHGHDEEAKALAARFLEKLKLEPVVLHEQASSGRTIIEKFEVYTGDVGFAVILLTPDDVGSSAKDTSACKPRARQNVIMELGYFMGKLGRARVCALHKGGVELPSDYQGVIYIEMDPAGAWKQKLAQELVEAKLPIELAGLLG